MPNIPNLFIVGAAKAGTTSLYNYLSKSDEVFMCPVKEPHYFSDTKETITGPASKYRYGNYYHSIVFNNEKEYLSLFSGANNHKYIAEASPSYLFDKQTPERIKSFNPYSKIIIILREPIERAYSHYLMDYKTGLQKLPFYEALIKDIERKEKGWGISHLYVELGLYTDQVNRYFESFDINNILILNFDHFIRDIHGSLIKIANFLGISKDFIKDINTNEKYNVFTKPSSQISLYILRYGRKLSYIFPHKIRESFKNNLLLKESEKPPLQDKARELLKSFYTDDIIKLNKLIVKKYDSTFRFNLK